MRITTSVKKDFIKVAPEVNEEKIKKLRKEHDKLVKGMFEFVDAQGGWLDFSYRWFKGDDLVTIRLMHGEICELPMGIVKHLNNTYKKIRNFDISTPDKATELNARGMPTSYTKVSRIRFTPMEVM
jgi:hypothetical protein